MIWLVRNRDDEIVAVFNNEAQATRLLATFPRPGGRIDGVSEENFARYILPDPRQAADEGTLYRG